MSADKVRRLLGSLLDDPENEKAWINLEERAISGELQELGEELPFMLAESRLMFAERGEAEAVLRVLDVEVELTPDAPAKARLLRERARVAEEELLDDRTALASVDALLSLGNSPDALEMKDRLTSKKARWKEILAAYKRHAENDTTDPALIASHLGSSRGVGYLILQAEGAFDINTVMAGILVLTAFALALDAAVGRIEQRLMKWQPKSGETEKL
jgi:uncharacterized protein YfcZ (UPF0381/DUF406 family)